MKKILVDYVVALVKNPDLSDEQKINQLETLNLSTNDLADLKTENDCSILHEATLNGGTILATWLLNKCPELIDAKSNAGTNVLFYAAKYSNKKLCDFFIKTEPRLVYEQNKRNQTLLHFISFGKTVSEACYEKLVNIDEFNKPDEDGNYPIHNAARSGNTELVNLLLKKETNINIPDNQGLYPLHIATKFNHLDIVQQLIENGTSPELLTNDTHKTSPIHIASGYGNLEILKFLKKFQGKLNEPNGKGWYPIHCATHFAYNDLSDEVKKELYPPQDAEKYHYETVKYFLDNGIPVNQTSNNELGTTPLNIAAEFGYLNIVILLCERGASINEAKKDGWFPIHNAIQHPKIVSFFLKQKPELIDQAQQNQWGWSPFHTAAAEGCIETMQLLLNNGANSNAPDKKGDYPIHIAAVKNQIAILELLLKQNVPIEQLDKFKRSPLHLAIAFGSLETVKFLLEKSAVINQYDAYGYLPIHRACEVGKMEVVKLLIEYGASLYLHTANGKLPLHLAAENGHVECVSYLLTETSAAVFPQQVIINSSSVTEIQTYLAAAICHGQVDVIKQILKLDETIKNKFSAFNARYVPIIKINTPTSIIHMIESMYIQALKTNSKTNDKNQDQVLLEKAETILQLLVEEGGADINGIDLDGNTILHRLAKSSVLFFTGSTININNNNNTSTSVKNRPSFNNDIAAIINFINLLISYGANCEITNGQGLTFAQQLWKKWDTHSELGPLFQQLFPLLMKKGIPLIFDFSEAFNRLNVVDSNRFSHLKCLLELALDYSPQDYLKLSVSLPTSKELMIHFEPNQITEGNLTLLNSFGFCISYHNIIPKPLKLEESPAQESQRLKEQLFITEKREPEIVGCPKRYIEVKGTVKSEIFEAIDRNRAKKYPLEQKLRYLKILGIILTYPPVSETNSYDYPNIAFSFYNFLCALLSDAEVFPQKDKQDSVNDFETLSSKQKADLLKIFSSINSSEHLKKLTPYLFRNSNLPMISALSFVLNKFKFDKFCNAPVIFDILISRTDYLVNEIYVRSLHTLLRKDLEKNYNNREASIIQWINQKIETQKPNNSLFESMRTFEKKLEKIVATPTDKIKENEESVFKLVKNLKEIKSEEIQFVELVKTIKDDYCFKWFKDLLDEIELSPTAVTLLNNIYITLYQIYHKDIPTLFELCTNTLLWKKGKYNYSDKWKEPIKNFLHIIPEKRNKLLLNKFSFFQDDTNKETLKSNENVNVRIEKGGSSEADPPCLRMLECKDVRM